MSFVSLGLQTTKKFVKAGKYSANSYRRALWDAVSASGIKCAYERVTIGTGGYNVIIKKQSIIWGLSLGLTFILFSMPARAQDRRQIQGLASNISNAAQEAWNAIQYERNSGEFDNPSTQRLYWRLRNFNQRAAHFAQESREGWESEATLRNEARQLVAEASRINRIMFQSNIPDSVREEWSEVNDSVDYIADIYNFPYNRERGLARRDFDYNYNYNR